MASSSRGRGRGNGTDQRDGAQQPSGGFASGILTGLGIAAGGLLLGYGLSQMMDETSHSQEEEYRRRPRPANDLPPRRRTSNTPNTEDIPQEKRCVVCLNGEKEVIVLDCGHVCMCINCGHEIMSIHHPKCPICRAPIDSVKKFYM